MSPPPLYRSCAEGIEISVVVVPRSSRSEVVGIHDHALKVKLTKAPVDGAANEECCWLLAKEFGVPRRSVSIVGGSASRRKVVRIGVVSEAAVAQVLQDLQIKGKG